MLKWLPYELHTHTTHSDGKQTIQELISSAKDMGLNGIAITDHNTISTFEYIDSNSIDINLNIIKGLEWTTFWGHILLLGIKEYVDWRDITLDNVNEKIRKAKKKSGLIGIAHPFNIGNPVATGCYFEYDIEDWNLVDYIEVWSETFPSLRQKNIKAFKFWTELLNKGYRISGVSGRDWHENNPEEKYIATTYIGLKEDEEESIENIIDNIKKGHLISGFGYIAVMSINFMNKTYSIGDTIKITGDYVDMKVDIDIKENMVKCNSDIDKEKLKINVNSNKGSIYYGKVSEHGLTFEYPCKDIRWVRAELYVEIDKQEVMISFTNPIYFNF